MNVNKRKEKKFLTRMLCLIHYLFQLPLSKCHGGLVSYKFLTLYLHAKRQIKFSPNGLSETDRNYGNS